MLCGAKNCQIRLGERWNRRPNAREYKTQSKHERKNLSHLISSFFPKNSNPSLPALCCPSGRRERGLLPAIVLPIPFFLAIVPASITVPVMVMPDPAAISFPITFMPLPMVSHRIPIAVDPNVFGSGVCWKNVNDPRRWRRADPDADRDLSAKAR